MGVTKLLVPMVVLVLVINPTLCQVEPDTMDNVVPIQEPAFLLGVPGRPVQSSGGRISMTCVAYGSPAPTIVWSSDSQEIDNYASLNNAKTNVYTTVINDPSGLPVVVSVLELCAATYNDSLVMDYRCTATNSLSGTPTFLGLSNTAVFDIVPIIREAPAIVAAPTEDRFVHNGARFSITCAAFGSPRPEVWLGSAALGIANFEDVNNPMINVYTEEIDTGDFVFYVATTLEICGTENDMDFYNRYVEQYECYAFNGVEASNSSVGVVQSIEFIAQPFVRIQRFDIQYYTHRLEVDIYFDGLYDPTFGGCPNDKLSYASSSDPAAPDYRSFSPRVPGTCSQISGGIKITWDNRDFLGFIENEFTSDTQSVYLYTRTEVPFSSFIPVEQIPNTAPLVSSNFNDRTLDDTQFNIIAMDIYRTPSMMSLYIHFDAIVDTQSFDLVDRVDYHVTLSSAGTSVNLISPTIIRQSPRFAKSVRIQISTTNRNQLAGACVNRADCSLSFSRGRFVNSHAGRNTIGQQNSGYSVGARNIWSISNFAGSVYMNLLVEFVGTSYEIPLTPGRPYLINTNLDETITRVDCHGVNDTHINPKMYFNGQRLDDQSVEDYKWPIASTYEIPLGLITADQLGLFTCTTYEDSTNISHILHSRDPYVNFLNGNEYTVEIWEPIVISFAYLFNEDITTSPFTITQNGNPPPSFENRFNFVADKPFTAQFIIDQPILSSQGEYHITVTRGTVQTPFPFTIKVLTPRVSISPAVHTFMPYESVANFSCLPSNLDIPVYWTRSDNPGTIVSREHNYQFAVSGEALDELEGVSFNCFVTNLDRAADLNSLPVASASSIFRNTNDSLGMFMTNNTVTRRTVVSEEVIVVTSRFSNSIILECQGHIDSGVTDLYWTIIREGDDPLVPESDFTNDNYTVALGDNYLMLTLTHLEVPFRGSVRCNSRTSDEEINVYFQADERIATRCQHEVDPVWKIQWRPANISALDGQPCPTVNGRVATGTASRMCTYGGFLRGGVWEEVDVSECQTDLENVMAELDLFLEDDQFLDDLNYRLRSSKLSRMLNEVVEPGLDSLFPQDLKRITSVLSWLVFSVIENRDRLSQVHFDSFETFDSLLHVNHTGGWLQLRDSGDKASATLLNSALLYADYLYNSLNLVPGQAMISREGDNIEILTKRLLPLVHTDQTFVYGELDNNGYSKVFLNSTLLNYLDPEGVKFWGFKNLNNFMPRDQPDFNINTDDKTLFNRRVRAPITKTRPNNTRQRAKSKKSATPTSKGSITSEDEDETLKPRIGHKFECIVDKLHPFSSLPGVFSDPHSCICPALVNKLVFYSSDQCAVKAREFMRNAEFMVVTPHRPVAIIMIQTQRRTYTIIASNLLSIQFTYPDGFTPPFTLPADSLPMFTFDTLSTARVTNPRIVFWDSAEEVWSEDGVESEYVVTDNGEFKTFRVTGETNRSMSFNNTSTFGVAMDVYPYVFTFTLPVYIGCGVILLGCCLSVFVMLLTCCIDGARKFFTVAFFIHLSFFVSLICAFVAFFAGVETAIQHRLGCIATAGLLHYFFTAAFTWLLCEVILVWGFKISSRKWPLIFLFFLIGWGIPAIPTAISLGLQHTYYGTTAQCFFNFDGDVSQNIVIAFLAPKIILVGIIFILLVVAAIANCYFAYEKMSLVQPRHFKPYSCMLWFIWVSVILLTLLLSALWSITMLMVNGSIILPFTIAGTINSIILDMDIQTNIEWAFLGLSCALSLYIFIFCVTVLLVNRRIEYDGNPIFEKDGALLPDSGGTDYRNLAPLPEKRFSSQGMSLPVTIENPVFGSTQEEDSFDDDDDDDDVKEKVETP